MDVNTAALTGRVRFAIEGAHRKPWYSSTKSVTAMTESPERIAGNILGVFDDYQHRFARLTGKAADRFLQSDWAGMRRDALDRLDLYPRQVALALSQLGTESGEADWRAVKSAYASAIAGRLDAELAETFYNSVVRRAFNVIGVDAGIEFTADDFQIPRIEDRHCPICTAYAPVVPASGFSDLFRDILAVHRNTFHYRDLARDAERIAHAVTAHLETRCHGSASDLSIASPEMIDAVFYRDQAAFLIGRFRCGDTLVPLVIALVNHGNGIAVDAVLLTSEEISILFSFTRSYFHVRVDHPAEMVNFLKTLIPPKRVSEIFTSLGFHKHGKAELFRELTRAMETSDDPFDIAPGERGMVMLVFTLPSFDVVFKVIKDQFEYPKQTSRDAVRSSYDLVFRHDRAGRLVDAQEFEHLDFPLSRFSPALLEEFRKSARQTVEIRGDRVIIRHLYTERRLIPLDIYLKTSPPADAGDALLDYGKCIKELAATNIFPGDLFLKNFGVTRHGRVVFYDYDELCLLTDCRFRALPPPRDFDDEMASAPWFFVDENDVFPEEFPTFLRFPENLKSLFFHRHGDLFTPDFWQRIQEKLRSGAIIPIVPYRESRRFKTPSEGG